MSVLAVTFTCEECCADGGRLAASARYGDLDLAVFVAPAAPRLGIVDISILALDNSSRRSRIDIPFEITLTSVENPKLILTERARDDLATNKLMQAAHFDIATAGRWKVHVSVAGATDTAVSFEISIARGIFECSDLAWWIGWPAAAVALFVAHQWLMRRDRRNLKRVSSTRGVSG